MIGPGESFETTKLSPEQEAGRQIFTTMHDFIDQEVLDISYRQIAKDYFLQKTDELVYEKWIARLTKEENDPTTLQKIQDQLEQLKRSGELPQLKETFDGLSPRTKDLLERKHQELVVQHFN